MLWRDSDPLLLASRSEARRILLAAAGVPVEICPADIDERALQARAGLSTPHAIAGMLAREKALAVARSHPGRLTLGADQTLGFNEQCLSKPADRTAARAQLLALRGFAHTLYSAIVFVQDRDVLFEHVAPARLVMRSFSDDFLERYLDAAGEAVTQSVGGYQLEGPGVQLFERIDGDYFTILGLPLLDALGFLRRHGSLAA
jgi:septum formation protein